MRKTIFALLIILTPLVTIFGQADPAVPVPEKCICSGATSAKYIKPGSSTASEVYVANCRCAPQSCVVTWSIENSKTAISLDCTDATLPKEPSNCVDFTSLPTHKITGLEQLGMFQINPLKWTTYATTEIGGATITDNNGVEAPYSPNSLKFNPSTEIRLSSLTKKLDVTYVPGQPGGIKAYWINGNGQYVTVTVGAADKVYKVNKISFTDNAGFDKIVFQTVEHSYLRMCAFR